MKIVLGLLPGDATAPALVDVSDGSPGVVVFVPEPFLVREVRATAERACTRQQRLAA